MGVWVTYIDNKRIGWVVCGGHKRAEGLEVSCLGLNSDAGELESDSLGGWGDASDQLEFVAELGDGELGIESALGSDGRSKDEDGQHWVIIER